MVTGILAGEVYALGEMMDHMVLLRERYRPCVDLSPGVVGLVDCEKVSTHLKKERGVAEKGFGPLLFADSSSLGPGRSGQYVLASGTRGPSGWLDQS